MAVVQMPFVNSVPPLSEEGSTPGSYLCSMPSLAYSNACSAALLHSWKMPAYPAAPEPQQQQQQQEQQQASASPEEAAQASSGTCTTQDLLRHTVQVPDGATLRLNLDDPVQRGYLEAYGAELVDKGQNTTSFFTLTAAGHAGLQEATEQLHRMFLRATEHAIYNDALLRDEFLIPKALWSRVRASWEAQQEDVVSGRFDFALTDTGVKVYEYNADSASCLVECGTMCDKWAKAAGIGHVGSSSGSMLFSNLVQTWAARKVDGVLHMLHDADPEERIHTLYMKSAAEQAGVRCKVYDSVASFSWTTSGDIQDEDGEVIRSIWKTWNWQTILDQLKDTDAGAAPSEQAGSCAAAPGPRLADILLSQQVRVFEPLWTLLPACKAILPLLWELYPNHPLLLNSAFELTPELVQTGYASKPVTGRGGNNVILYNTGGTLIEEAPGRWAEDKLVYQELCHMPKYNGKNVQVCCWSVNGMYAGTVLRWGESNIIRFENSLPALRVV